MKTCLVVIGLMLAANVQGQIHVNPGTIFLVRSGTVVSTDSLTLTPNVDMNLQGLAIQVSYVPVPVPGSGSSIARVCNITSPLSFSGTVGMFFSNSQLNGNTAANLQLVYNDGTSDIITTGSVVNTSINYITNVFPTPVTLTKVTAVNGGAPLDISLLNFTARAEGQRARIEWMTADEKKIDHFRIDRSDDGTSYTPLVNRKAVHQSGAEVNYLAYDEAPIVGLNYYKLVIFDKTGKEYSGGTRTVRFGSKDNLMQVSMYPNPVTDVLTIQFSSAPPDGAIIDLADISGRKMRSLPATGSTMQFPMTDLPWGVYMLSYRDVNQHETFKIEKL